VGEIVEDEEAALSYLRSSRCGVPLDAFESVIGIYVDPIEALVGKTCQDFVREAPVRYDAGIPCNIGSNFLQIEIDQVQLGGLGARQDVLGEIAPQNADLCHDAAPRQRRYQMKAVCAHPALDD
jgi:hypothetical protein